MFVTRKIEVTLTVRLDDKLSAQVDKCLELAAVGGMTAADVDDLNRQLAEIRERAQQAGDPGPQ